MSDSDSDTETDNSIDFYDNDDWDETGEDQTDKPNLPDRRKTVFALPSVSNLTKLDSALSAIFQESIKPAIIAQTKSMIQSRLGKISLEFEQLVSQCAAAIDEFKRLEDLLVATPGTFEDKSPLINDSLAKVNSTITGLFSEIQRSHKIILAANSPLTEQEKNALSSNKDIEEPYPNQSALAASSRWSVDSNHPSVRAESPQSPTPGRNRAQTFSSAAIKPRREHRSSCLAIGAINTKNPTPSNIFTKTRAPSKPKPPAPQMISPKITDLSGFTTMERSRSSFSQKPSSGNIHRSNGSFVMTRPMNTSDGADTKISKTNLPQVPDTPTSSHGRRDSLLSRTSSIFETSLPAAGNLYSSMRKKMSYVVPESDDTENKSQSIDSDFDSKDQDQDQDQIDDSPSEFPKQKQRQPLPASLSPVHSINYPTKSATADFSENMDIVEPTADQFEFSTSEDQVEVEENPTDFSDQVEVYSNILESDLAGKPEWIQELILNPDAYPTEEQLKLMETCLVRWSYSAVLDDELTMEKGEIIHVISRTNSVDPLWWLGYSPRSGQKGRLPFNYCRLLQNESKTARPERKSFSSSSVSSRKSSTLSSYQAYDPYINPSSTPGDKIIVSPTQRTLSAPRSQSDIVKPTQPSQTNSQFAKNAVIYNDKRPSSQTTLLAGFLWKKGARGHNFKNWRNRHFQLQPRTLLYFKQPFSPEPLGRLPLHNCTLIKDASANMSTKDQKNYPFAFLLQMPKKSWVLASPDPENLNQWYKMLSESIDACKT